MTKMCGLADIFVIPH